jgi:hypothetical protein
MLGDSNLIYVYGLIPTKEWKMKQAPSFSGMEQEPIFMMTYHEITACICHVNEMDYSQEQIDRKLKDPVWLNEKAFHHHECISFIHKYYTVLPMSFCTLFKTAVNLEKMLSENYAVLLGKLENLYGKQEWNLKVYCDMEQLKSFVARNHLTVLEMQNNIEKMPVGKQYLMKKKLQNLIATTIENEQVSRWGILHQQFQAIASDWVLRKNWGKEITRRKDDMLGNCDYLIDREEVEAFLACIHENESIFQEYGLDFQVTGPWPPYHFAKTKVEA